MNREKVFKGKAAFHRRRAKLPFREKVRILIQLQALAKGWEKE